MKKRILLFLLISYGVRAFPQQNFPIIKADSLYIDVRVDDDYFVKAGWILDSTKKPDIFYVGSKWLYETKKITFITDSDSISVNMKPGDKYDFMVLFNKKTPCYIQLVTSPNPVFMNKKFSLPILLGFIGIFLSLYIYRKKIDKIKLLQFGYIATLLFWCMTFLSGYVHGNYNHFKNVISELGAIGTKSEILTSSVLMILASICVFFSVGFYSISQKLHLSLIPAILSFCMPITMIWAGIFTLGNEFHGLTGAFPFLIILAFLLSYLFWKRDKRFTVLSKISGVCFLISILVLLRLIKPFGYMYEGLIQRFFYLAWTIWTISTTYYLSVEIKKVKIFNKNTLAAGA